jgi:hypothetical protein
LAGGKKKPRREDPCKNRGSRGECYDPWGSNEETGTSTNIMNPAFAAWEKACAANAANCLKPIPPLLVPQGTSTTVTLTFSTSEGGPGHGTWGIDWKLGGATDGWIIQTLLTLLIMKDGTYIQYNVYSEPFIVHNGHAGGDLFDRTNYATQQGLIIIAYASYYEHLTLPASFNHDATGLTGALPSMWGVPNLPAPTAGPVIRVYYPKSPR